MHEERRRSTKQDELPDPQVCKYFVIIHYSESSNRFMSQEQNKFSFVGKQNLAENCMADSFTAFNKVQGQIAMLDPRSIHVIAQN
jgi:hypothetical protein